VRGLRVRFFFKTSRSSRDMVEALGEGVEEGSRLGAWA